MCTFSISSIRKVIEKSYYSLNGIIWLYDKYPCWKTDGAIDIKQNFAHRVVLFLLLFENAHIRVLAKNRKDQYR